MSKQHKKTESAKKHLDVGDSPKGSFEVNEPVPEYFEYDGFNVVKGINNTLISLGRDRLPSVPKIKVNTDISDSTPVDDFKKTPVLEIDDVYNPVQGSGNSQRQTAGAIDIVVGRGSPFPFQKFKNAPYTLGPLYNTIPINAADVDNLLGGSHPGYIMDAARIYISQMCKPDEYFKIAEIKKMEFKKTLSIGLPEYSISKVIEDNKESGPEPVVMDTSAIVAKSDKIRMHARQNIKIVTGGKLEQFNSQGKSIVSQDIGIHLIAGNGQTASGSPLPQHPMLLGSNVVAAFDAVITLVEELTTVVANFIKIQNRFNGKITNHVHAAGSGTTLGDFVLQLEGPVTQLETLTKGELQTFYGDINLSTFKNRFLSPATKETDGHNNYICSKYNTVN